MNTHVIDSASDLSDEVIDRAKCDMAAVFRIAARENLHEGIDNHCSYSFADGTFLINRWGVHWSQMKRCDILRIDHDGNVLEGTGTVEKTAFYVHEAVHRLCPHAVTILHTHMPYTTALTCIEGGLNETLSQDALFFYRNVAYEAYGGLANDRIEGERLAENIGEKIVAMLDNHGVMVMARTPGIAIHNLYFLERAARLQIIAQSSEQPVKHIPDDVAEMAARQLAELDEDKETYFVVMKNILDENEPDYKE